MLPIRVGPTNSSFGRVSFGGSLLASRGTSKVPCSVSSSMLLARSARLIGAKVTCTLMCMPGATKPGSDDGAYIKVEKAKHWLPLGSSLHVYRHFREYYSQGMTDSEGVEAKAGKS